MVSILLSTFINTVIVEAIKSITTPTEKFKVID